MNSQELNHEWSKVCEWIENHPNLSSSQMKAFFSRLVPQAMSDDYLFLTADNDFIKSWIEGHYLGYIIMALKELRGVEYTVEVQVDVNQETQSNTDESSPSPREVEPSASKDIKEEMQEDKFIPEVESKPEPKPDHTPSDHLMNTMSTLTFDNFVIGESNRMAYSMAVTVAEEPGYQILNPLFIYGRSGLGKTHLMRAIQNYIAETRPELRTVYEDSADFLNKYVEATLTHDKEKTSYRNFKDYYENADVLLIDDIQSLQGKERTLDIVFQIFKKLIDAGKQVVLSADRAPKNIDLDERLQSRFNMGGTIDIQPPEVETKMGIIKSFIDEYRMTNDQPDFTIPEDVQRYIAESSSSNIRELKSAITKVIYQMNSFGLTDLSVDEVSRLLENHFSGGITKPLTIADIQKQVELYYSVPHQELIGKKRSRKIVYARQVAIYLCRQMLDLPFNDIAKNFGGRDHTTIMYSVTNVEEKMKESRDLREELENLRRRLREL